ncbi:MAG: DNA adenine methylase [Verrucomicrobia bacterium]|nr:DNA adenine methylase [Verrucomicrobiota bacterium]
MDDLDPTPQLPRARPVIGRPGGKQRLLKYILPLIPEHTLYCEVFGGGGAVLLGKPESDLEVINDLDGDLISFYRQVKFHLDPVLDEMDLVMNSRREFRDYLQQPGLTEIQRAARWFIRNKLSFGAMGRHFGTSRKTPTASLGSRAQRMLAIRALNRRFDKVCIEELPWEKCLEIYDSEAAFFFLDPPYLDAGGAAYAGWSEHELTRFCHRIVTLQGKWLFTFQDCAQVRELMRDYEITAIERANGIGNRTGATGRKYHEVIISSERPAPVRQRKARGA